MRLLKLVKEGKTESIINIDKIDCLYSDQEDLVHLSTEKNSFDLKGINIDDLLILIIDMNTEEERYGNTVLRSIDIK